MYLWVLLPGVLFDTCNYEPVCQITLFTKQGNFRLVQIESICRLQCKYDSVIEFVSGREEILVVKEENAGHQHLPFPQCFQKASSVRLGLCGTGLSSICICLDLHR